MATTEDLHNSIIYFVTQLRSFSAKLNFMSWINKRDSFILTWEFGGGCEIEWNFFFLLPHPSYKIYNCARINFLLANLKFDKFLSFF